MVATSVFPSPVAISATLPSCSAIAADELHVVGHHVPGERLPRHLHLACPPAAAQASFTVANASGRISSSAACVAS